MNSYNSGKSTDTKILSWKTDQPETVLVAEPGYPESDSCHLHGRGENQPSQVVL